MPTEHEDFKKAVRLKNFKGPLTGLTINGFKSISEEQRLDIRPITVLAGINSSGKTSAIQPLLLMKQTLEAAFDPGCFLLQGPNVKFASADQLLSKQNEGNRKSFTIGLESGPSSLRYKYSHTKNGFDVTEVLVKNPKENISLKPSHTSKELFSLMPYMANAKSEFTLQAHRSGCFLELVGIPTGIEHLSIKFPFSLIPNFSPKWQLKSMIHLPGHRGNPERTYPVAAVGDSFPGTFENYTASIINKWKTENPEKLSKLSKDLQKLNLTWKITSRKINDTQVELQVGRLTSPSKGGARDLISIADVGFGVSQTVPVLVALRTASAGQIIYLEQPEIHLHPKAQHTLAEILAEAANQGVIIIVETHSQILLTGIQSMIAEEKLSADKVALHWFSRKNGITKIDSATLDDNGAFGNWPEDFSETLLNAEARYIEAVTQS
ncbi:MAG: DUF3696 domain-containing protein [Cyanobacteria bacterium TGS_CYA1]|nr:DUF3696 domain-containing protein [Cyanobacteria bacterium TGS_CYA1]